MDKHTEIISVRLSREKRHFLSRRAEQLGMESPSEVIRALVDAEMQRAVHEHSLLADALGISVNKENFVNGGDAK